MPIPTWLFLIEDDERMKDKYMQSFIVKFMENENYTESFCCIIGRIFTISPGIQKENNQSVFEKQYENVLHR